MNKDSPHPEDNTLQILANALEGMTHNLRCGVNLIELICRSVDGLNRDESDALNFVTRGMKGEIKKAEIICEGLQEWPGEEKGQNEEIELANDQAQFAKELVENLAKMRQTPKPTRAAS